jgi:hypothetical protein
LGKLDANVGPSREAKTTPQKANWQKLWCPSNNSNVEGWNKKKSINKKGP